MNDLRTGEITMNLIEEVKKRPFLWHSGIKKDRIATTMAWVEISEILTMPEGYIKPKWKNLRDVFRREHAKVLEHGKRGTKWQYYKPLLFLNEGAEREIDEDDNNESENYTYTPEQDDENDKSNDNDPINNDTMQSACIKIEQDHDQYFEVVENEVVVPKKRKYIRRESDDTDYDLLYLKSLVPYFKQLEPMRKLIVRSRIQDILMNEIARSSASSNNRVESSSSSYK